jgi:hypothetical protein
MQKKDCRLPLSREMLEQIIKTLPKICNKIFKRITAGSLLAFGATFQNLAI